jgi:cell division protein FtsL
MAQKPSNTSENKVVQFVFEKQNYQILIASILIVIIGFALMSGDTDIYSFRKIVLAPIVVLAGFGLGFYAILKKPTVKA